MIQRFYTLLCVHHNKCTFREGHFLSLRNLCKFTLCFLPLFVFPECLRAKPFVGSDQFSDQARKEAGILASLSYCNKVPQVQGLKTTEIYCCRFRSLEIWNQHVSGAMFLLKPAQENLSLYLSSFLVACDSPRDFLALLLQHFDLCVCVSISVSLLFS